MRKLKDREVKLFLSVQVKQLVSGRARLGIYAVGDPEPRLLSTVP